MFADFGPSSNPDAFYQQGHKSSVDMPAWLASMGLTAYEYSCSRGVNIGEDTARDISLQAAQYGIKMSVHAPYYINLASTDSKLMHNTRNHIIKSMQAAKWLSADRVVFHMGGPGKQDRRQAMEQVKRSFSAILDEVAGLDLQGVKLAPETMGKVNQLGTLAEVLELCTMSDIVIPTVDFGHLHAVTQGGYTTQAEFAAVFEQVAQTCSEEIAKNLHIHFSRIEFTKGGEKKHWTFADTDYGSDYRPLIAAIAVKGYTPRIICESSGTQAHDALIMQKEYRRLLAQAGAGSADKE